ncbi:MAG: FHA domain-containing protein [Myxococcota bacterium]
MGSLRGADGRTVALPAELTVGRSPTSLLRLEPLHVSSRHAVLTYVEGSWFVRDLKSRNGTFVNGERLSRKKPVAKLARGSVVAFGAPHTAFDLIDTEAPSLVAISEARDRIVGAVDGALVLPPEGDVEWWIGEDDHGIWKVHPPEGPSRRPSSGEPLYTRQGTWTLLLPGGELPTTDVGSWTRLKDLHIRFEVSRDEEKCRIVLDTEEVSLALPPREHFYLLLTLARARGAGDGWVSVEALEQGAPSAGYCDVALHRCRRQLVAAGVSEVAGLVDVEPRRRRLGHGSFSIQVVDGF